VINYTATEYTNKEYKMKYLEKLTKVNESFTVNRYDNGFMIEVSGRDTDNDWKSCKILCTNEDELFTVIKEALSMEMDS
jgi:hypothetical protein